MTILVKGGQEGAPSGEKAALVWKMGEGQLGETGGPQVLVRIRIPGEALPTKPQAEIFDAGNLEWARKFSRSDQLPGDLDPDSPRTTLWEEPNR